LDSVSQNVHKKFAFGFQSTLNTDDGDSTNVCIGVYCSVQLMKFCGHMTRKLC